MEGLCPPLRQSLGRAHSPPNPGASGAKTITLERDIKMAFNELDHKVFLAFLSLRSIFLRDEPKRKATGNAKFRKLKVLKNLSVCIWPALHRLTKIHR
jgi:hypothetical protein